jgi:hypothetical protein
MLFNLKIKTLLPIIVACMIGFQVSAQGDALSLDDTPKENIQSRNAFNGANIIYNESTNMLRAKQLDLVFGHRFGKVTEGAFNAFGLDQAFIRIGFEYGIKDWLSAGIGRTSAGKNFDFYLKHRPLIQTKGAKNIPVSVMFFWSTAFSSNELHRQNEIFQTNQFVNQLVYTFQASVSRQFSSRFSAQLTGSAVHRNAVFSEAYENNVFGIGAGARFKMSDRIHLVAEYNHMINNADGIYDPVAIGIDVVAGGHVFNLHFANSSGLIAKDYLTATTDNFFDGNIRFGFAIRRSFNLKKNTEGK